MLSTQDIKAAVALGIAVADEMVSTYAGAAVTNSELIRSALLEGLAISAEYAGKAFEAIDSKLEEAGFRNISSGERARARRIIAGASDAALLPKLIEMLEAGNSLQDISEECPKLSNRGRPSGKGAGKRPSDAKDVTEDAKAAEAGAPVAVSVKAITDWIAGATNGERAQVLRASMDALIASIKVPENRVKATEAAKVITAIFGVK